MIIRSEIKKIEKWLKKDKIIIISGARQVGKTTILKYLKTQTEKKFHCYYFNLEIPSVLQNLNEYESFVSQLQLSNKSKIYIFIDEIQYLDNPSAFLKYMYDEYKDKIKLIVTGSANLEIKASLQDSLVGRKKTFITNSFSFEEFLEAKQYKAKTLKNQNNIEIKNLLEEYLLFGGMPEIVLTQDKEIKKELLIEYISTYVNKDIRSIVQIDNINVFNNLNINLAKIIGNIKVDQNISKTIGTSHVTLKRYLSILKNTFIFDFLHPYYTNPLTQIKKHQKVFASDLGIRNAILHNFLDIQFRQDVGNLFENFVYNILKKRFNLVYYFRNLNKNEIDFIVKFDDKIYGYEVKFASLTNLKNTKGIRAIEKKLQLDKLHIVHFGETFEKDGLFYLNFMDL